MTSQANDSGSGELPWALRIDMAPASPGRCRVIVTDAYTSERLGERIVEASLFDHVIRGAMVSIMIDVAGNRS